MPGPEFFTVSKLFKFYNKKVLKFASSLAPLGIMGLRILPENPCTSLQYGTEGLASIAPRGVNVSHGRMSKFPVGSQVPDLIFLHGVSEKLPLLGIPLNPSVPYWRDVRGVSGEA